MTNPGVPSGHPRLSSLKLEASVFVRHLLALAWPGVRVPQFQVHTFVPGDLSAWPDEDLNLLIEEGRRQSDDQINDLEKIRSRCQFSFTTALALLGVVLASVKVDGFTDLGPFIAWCAAVTFTLLCMLASASVMVSRSEFYVVDTALSSQETPPIRKSIATDYAISAGVGANTIATRLTIYRDAVWCLIIGAVAFSVTWLWVALFKNG